MISTFISLSVPWTFIKIMEMKVRYKGKEAQGILKDATRPFYVILKALELTRLQRFFKLKSCGNPTQKFENKICFWKIVNHVFKLLQLSVIIFAFSLTMKSSVFFFNFANRFLFSMFLFCGWNLCFVRLMQHKIHIFAMLKMILLLCLEAKFHWKLIFQ